MERNTEDGIRTKFYTDLIDGYQERERSFLYRAFWTEGVRGLLKDLKKKLETLEKKKQSDADPDPDSRNCASVLWEEQLSWIPETGLLKPRKDGTRLREALGALMKAFPGLADDLLPKKKERLDFWKELLLGDAGYLAGLLPEDPDLQGEEPLPGDTRYYLWLIEYLDRHDIYYKDKLSGDGHVCLYRLLLAGLQGTTWQLRPSQMQERFGTGFRNIRTATQIGQDLEKLARAVREEQAAGRTGIAGRLHDLKRSVKTRDGQTSSEDYLPWLTAHLERTALHVKIRTWLQDSGYPLDKDGHLTAVRKPRKQDFSMRLFEAYCDSEEGYQVYDKIRAASYRGWRMNGQGFCMLDIGDEQLDAFLRAWEKSGRDYLYLPLAVHLLTGCVFFLAGKENYRDLYQKDTPGSREYRSAARFGYDYLRLDKEHLERFPGDVAGALKLCPVFHENAGKSREEVLGDFKRYCREGGPLLEEIRTLNNAWSDKFFIPDVLRGFFEDPDDRTMQEESTGGSGARRGSRKAREAFGRTRELALD